MEKEIHTGSIEALVGSPLLNSVMDRWGWYVTGFGSQCSWFGNLDILKNVGFQLVW